MTLAEAQGEGYNLYMRNITAALLLVCSPILVRAAEADWSRQADIDALYRTMAASKEAAPSSKAAPALKMKPETTRFLRSIDIDPESKDVVDTYEEGSVWTSLEGDPDEFSLDILASKKRKTEITVFIKTRTFIRKLKLDFSGTALEKYDPGYLTSDERKLAGRRIVDEMMRKKG